MDIERTIEGGSGMNEIIRAMEERRSVRKFKPDMVPKEMIEQIYRDNAGKAQSQGKY